MRTLCVMLCVLIAVHIRADLIDNLVTETLNFHNAYPNGTTNGMASATLKAKNVLKVLKNSKSKIPDVLRSGGIHNKNVINKTVGNSIARNVFFADNHIKHVRISCDGKLFAYISKNNQAKQDCIHVIPLDNPDSIGSIITDNVAIKQAEFAGQRFIIYAYWDRNNCMKLISVDLASKDRRDITPIPNSRNIHLVTGNQEDIIAICNIGNEYLTYKINVETGDKQLIKQAQTPVIAIFDACLVPTLVYKNIQGNKADIFISQRTALGNNGERLIDKIDMLSEKYVSVNEKCCYKLKQIANQVYLCSITDNGHKQQVSIPNATRLSDCHLNLDKNNHLQFISITADKTRHVVCDKNIESNVRAISNKFTESSWNRVGASSDGNIWLIQVSHPQKSNAYYVYNVKRNSFKFITAHNMAIKKVALQSYQCVKIPTSDKQFITGYLTSPNNHNIQSPLVILINADGQHPYKWEYTPIIQLLANRGMSVLSLNCRSLSVAHDIETATKWCIEHNLAAKGNICLSAKKQGCEPAVKVFMNHPNLFAGCILLSSNLWEKISPFVSQIQKPMLMINCVREGEFNNLSAGSNLPITYIGYTQKLPNTLSAGIIELFLSKLYGTYCESIDQKDLNGLMVLMDGCNLINQDSITDLLQSNVSMYDVL